MIVEIFLASDSLYFFKIFYIINTLFVIYCAKIKVSGELKSINQQSF